MKFFVFAETRKPRVARGFVGSQGRFARGQPQQVPLQQQSVPQAPPQQQSSQQQSVDEFDIVSSG